LIEVFGMKIKELLGPDGLTDQVRSIHIPIAGANLRSSLKGESSKEVPKGDWQEVYRSWREAYDSGKAAFSQSQSASALVALKRD